MGPYSTRVAPALNTSAHQRLAIVIGVYTPCRSTSTGERLFRRCGVEVVDIRTTLLSGDVTLSCLGFADPTRPTQAATDPRSCGLHTVRDVVDPRHIGFSSRCSNEMRKIRKDVRTRDGALSSQAGCTAWQLPSRAQSSLIGRGRAVGMVDQWDWGSENARNITVYYCRGTRKHGLGMYV